MSRSTNAALAAAPRVALGAALCAAALAAAPLAPARAQPPTPAPSTRPAPAPADTGAARPVAADSARRAAPSDSSQRDSVIARQLRRDERATTPVYRRVASDRLRLTAVGVAAGLAVPDQVKATPLYTVSADYGALTPSVRAIFGLTVWSSQYKGSAVAGLRRAVAEAGDTPQDSVGVGRIRASDVALFADLRWRPGAFQRLRLPFNVRPWVSGGTGVHLLDVQGAPISGTFVERALDGVSFGVAGAAGVDATLLPNVQLTGQARYDLFSGAHFGSVRAGVFYVLDRRDRP